jgi:5-methylcytosine-specific restriction endonuclease McrA
MATVSPIGQIRRVKSRGLRHVLIPIIKASFDDDSDFEWDERKKKIKRKLNLVREDSEHELSDSFKEKLHADAPFRLWIHVFGIKQPGEIWVYRWRSWYVTKTDGLTEQEKQLEVVRAGMRHDQRYKQIRKQLEAFTLFEQTQRARRCQIPDSVKMFVWQRDQGKCVQCGSNKLLEFDHIIPVAEGGSNTERNLQLLCEICNRKKGRAI